MSKHGIERQEGTMAERLERMTAKAPSGPYLALTGAGMVASAALFLSGRREAGIFVGLWPLAMLMVGSYYRIAKLLGSESKEVKA